MSKLDNILNAKLQAIKSMEAFSATDEVKKEIKALMLELIGEDQKKFTAHGNKQMLNMANEQLRYENHFRGQLRQKVNEL